MKFQLFFCKCNFHFITGSWWVQKLLTSNVTPTENNHRVKDQANALAIRAGKSPAKQPWIFCYVETTPLQFLKNTWVFSSKRSVASTLKSFCLSIISTNFFYVSENSPKELDERCFPSDGVRVRSRDFLSYVSLFFEEKGKNGFIYLSHLCADATEPFMVKLKNLGDNAAVWFPHDGATVHTKRSNECLRGFFLAHLISLYGDIVWPMLSPDLTPYNNSLCVYVTREVFLHRPTTFDELKAASCKR